MSKSKFADAVRHQANTYRGVAPRELDRDYDPLKKARDAHEIFMNLTRAFS